MDPGLHRDGVYRELFFLGTGQPPASRYLSCINRWHGYGTDLGVDSRQAQTPAQNLWGSPAGYTNEDLERFLDLLYGLFSDVYTTAELRQVRVSDPFDRSEHPRQLRLVELTDWLEALVA